METVLYSIGEKIRLLRANGYVIREKKVTNFSKEPFAFKAGRKYNIDPAFDSTVKNILLMMNPGGEGGEEEEEQGFYTPGVGIDITGVVISLSHLGFENLTDPGADKILVWDNAAGSVGWDDLTVTSKVKVSSNDTTPGYLEDKLVLSYYGGNESEILELSTINEGANEIRVLQLDETKINHDNISSVSADDHHSQAHTLATTGPHTDSLPLTDLAPGTAGDIITRQATDWAVLAKGTENYVLKMGATYPAWRTVDWSELTGTQPAPVAHNHAWSDITSGVPTTFGGYGISDTLANLNTALSDATLYKWEADQGAVNIHGDNVVYGSTVSTACVGNDARLSNARTPTTHAMDSATYHTSTDITILNATTSKHGFLRKLGGGTTNYLRADGTWAAPPGTGGMTYPGAGIALSTGSAWGTSITNNSANWNTAYTHSQVAGGNSVHVSTTENTQWDAAYTHSIDNTQAHSDYLLNTTDTLTGNLTVTGYITTDGLRSGIGCDTYSHFARTISNPASTLYVQKVGNTTGEDMIARFAYGSESVSAGTIALTVSDYGIKAYFEGAIKLATTTVGVTVTGDLTTTIDHHLGEALYFASQNAYIYYNTTYGFYIECLTNGQPLVFRGKTTAGVSKTIISADADTGVSLYYLDTVRVDTTSVGVSVSGIMTATGNVAGNTYFLSTDTSAVFGTTGAGTVFLRPTQYDSSTVQSTFSTTLATIGTPMTVIGTLTVSSHIYQGDSDIHYFGASNDGAIFHSGVDFYFKSYFHGGRILLQGENLAGTNRALIYADPDAAVQLYHAGLLKLETTVNGVLITGRVQATDYYSGDGSQGMTTTVNVVATLCDDSGTLKQRFKTITIKDGLIISISQLGAAQTIPICPV